MDGKITDFTLSKKMKINLRGNIKNNSFTLNIHTIP